MIKTFDLQWTNEHDLVGSFKIINLTCGLKIGLKLLIILTLFPKKSC